MNRPETLTLICPHCDTPNPAFGEQRCVQCSLNMRSDREQARLQDEVQPLLEKMEQMTQNWEADTTQNPDEEHFSQWMKQAMAMAPEYPFLADYLHSLRVRLTPWLASLRKRRLLRLNGFILGGLCIPPLLALMWSADWVLVGMLALPVFGWTYLGMYPLMRSPK